MARAQYEEWLTPEALTLLQGWRRDGLEIQQIAHNMGIHPTTLSIWQSKYEKIKKALQKGREVCYYEVENALYKSAIGYDVVEHEQVENYDANGDLISKSVRKRSRHIPPNTGAICVILKNRLPDKWQDKPERADAHEVADDGFLDALKGSAADDWQDDDNIAADEELESGDLTDEE